MEDIMFFQTRMVFQISDDGGDITPDNSYSSLNDGGSRHLERLQADLAEERARNVSMRAEMEQIRREAEHAVEMGRSRIADVRRESAIRHGAVLSGLVDMDCLPLLNVSSISVDDDGNVSGIDEAFEDLRSKKPFLFSRRDSDIRSRGTARAVAAPRIRAPAVSNVREMAKSDYKSSLRKIAPAYNRRSN
jgi:hypothetical protein